MPALEAPPQAPDWYPDWARELADLYFSGATCVFVLHGNVHDLTPYPTPAGDRFVSLAEFLSTQVFGRWKVVLSYDLGGGLDTQAGSDPARLQEMVRRVSAQIGNKVSWPKAPDQALFAVNRLIELNLLAATDDRAPMAFLFPYAQYLLPAGDVAALAGAAGSRLVRVLDWAQNPYIKKTGMAFCLIAEKLNEVNDRLVQNPHVAAIEIPLPGADSRRRFIDLAAGAKPEEKLGSFTPESLTQLSNGLNLVNLNVVLSHSSRTAGDTLDAGRFRRMKKSAIERQCQGLVSFVEPKHTLDLVVGHDAAKERLRQDAAWLAEGRLDTSPMGYLFCGPVGTGKTFLAECYAGSVGIPCVKLQNFRSKYVGETEGNLQQVLTVLRSLGPIVVMIDEADAMLGDRQSGGDSGTSGRVFSMIASQMGDTQYRGRIIWMLLTCRPDLLPIDLKRQGRAEVHIPLFYPETEEEMQAMFRIMARKNGIQLAGDDLPDLSKQAEMSGADIESCVLSARRRAMADNRTEVTVDDLSAAVNTFIPSAQGLEKELQELVAVLECTDRAFLTEVWRDRLEQPQAAARLQERATAIRQILES
ncbi:ATP-dependent zinc metalloprotease FtsH 1 [Lignipirellula cremea]|uniref:Uncharacterized AAA domain-containing protein ycf46 n=1 Tax=Lignipirellula cremea TaxID=2528010 RepID=A0A518E009_9BACT|nr:ATP-dependent zinc metalloprotease FtsH 1 [Lignipirellula cremea]